MMDALDLQVVSSNSKTDAGGNVYLDWLSTSEILNVRWQGEDGVLSHRDGNIGLDLP